MTMMLPSARRRGSLLSLLRRLGMGRHMLRPDRVPPVERPEPRPIPRLLLWVIPVGVVLALGIGLWIAVIASTAEDDRDAARGETAATVQQSTTLADQVAAACAAGGETAEELVRRGACQQAAQIQVEPVPGKPGDPGKQGEPGPGPTEAQISSAVAAYLIAHPPPAGRAPTAAEVAAAVTSYLTANPPAPGRPPTAAEIASAVQTYYDANPPADGEPGQRGEPGDRGEKGEVGPPPTPEEIRAAVDAYLAEHPIPPGPSCPAGSTQLPVTYGDGTAGVGCVLDEQPPPAPDPEPDPEEDPGG